MIVLKKKELLNLTNKIAKNEDVEVVYVADPKFYMIWNEGGSLIINNHREIQIISYTKEYGVIFK